MHKKQSYYLILLFFIVSCRSVFIPSSAEYAGYQVAASVPKDTVLQMLMQPYRDSINKSMNIIIGRADKTLEKAQPEGTLGNFMADAMLYGARHLNPDAAFVNYGGIRITQLPAGDVTRSKIFELMPFDNIVVVQRIKGDILQEFLNLIAKNKGWPVAGIQFSIKDGKAINIKIGGLAIDLNKTYTIVNSDYVANGGDNASMLKTIPQHNEGQLMRDAIFDYIDFLKSGGKPISATIENRITNAQ